ncbi:uncharacterized mitochondrial protein-like protein [Tanacetum coccineum]
MLHEDVMDHIAKVLEMLDLINIPGVDSHQLRMKVFPFSLADDARQWWINEREGKITVWEELVDNFFVNFIPNHTMEKKKCWTKEIIRGLIHSNSYHDWNKRRMDDNILSSNNTTTDSFFKPCLKMHEMNNVEEEDERSQAKRKCDNTSNYIDEQPNKRMCKAEKFEAIKYSLRPNE